MDGRLKEVLITVLRIGAWWSGVPNPTRWNKIFSAPKRPDRLWDSPSLQLNGYRGSFPGEKRSGREVNHDLHLVPRLRKSGVICLLLLYAFMVCTGTTLFSTFVVWWLKFILLALWREILRNRMIQRNENGLLCSCVDEISRWSWNQTSAVIYRPSSWLHCKRMGFAFRCQYHTLADMYRDSEWCQ